MVTQHAAYNPEQITFRPLAEADLLLLHRWLNTPHVSQWWEVNGKRNPAYEDVTNKFTPRIHRPEPVSCFLVLYDTRPVAFIESCRMEDFPTEKTMLKVNPNAAGIDTFICEVDFLYQGFGTVYIRKFLKEIIFQEPAINSCIVDPEPSNKIAIRAYQKAGFNFSHQARNAKDNVMAFIMSISRESLYQPPAVL